MEALGALPFNPPLRPARLLARKNRFLALAEEAGRALELHVPSTGRLGELLLPGHTVWVAPAGPRARVAARLVAVGEDPMHLVAVDSFLAERLAALYLGPAARRRGVASGGERFDFELGDGTLVEVKAVTLYVDDQALFPDAPTARGRRQVARLAARAAQGRPGRLLFVLLGGPAACLRLHEAHDGLFAAAVRKAARAGVAVEAVAAWVTPGAARLCGLVPVQLGAGEAEP